MISPADRRRNHNLNPLFRMGTILENEIQYDQVQEFVKTIVNAGRRSGMDETTSLSLIKNYFAELSDAIFNACSEFYNNDIVSEPSTSYESEKLLEVSQVAEILKITPQAVRKIINSGKLPAQNFGERMTRVKESDLTKYISNRKDQ
jgi:excisionase family DNA binding protein